MDDLWRLLPLDAVGKIDEEAPPQDTRLPLLRAERAARAIVRFREGKIHLLLGGTVAELPYLSIASVRDGFIRFRPGAGCSGWRSRAAILCWRRPKCAAPSRWRSTGRRW